jgi:hypothetical protein
LSPIFIGGGSGKNVDLYEGNAGFEPRPGHRLSTLRFILLPSYAAYEDGTECSETSAYKIQKPGHHPKERIQHSEHGDCLKSRLKHVGD